MRRLTLNGVDQEQRGEDAPGGENSESASTIELGASEYVIATPLIEGRTASEVRWSAENRPAGPN